jgi:hypothetical protein
MQRVLIALVFIISGCMGISHGSAAEISGHVGLEGRIFFNSPAFEAQGHSSASAFFEAEYFHQWDNGGNFTFTPFARVDSQDENRTHMDIRELNYFYAADTWELRVGVGKVFWGVTETNHLVDTINQTDEVESLDREAKLGQPMVHLAALREWGVLDMFVLPLFRERTYPGEKGRLRTDPVVDTDNPIYESPDGDRHTDLAIRYSHTLGQMDFGLSHFYGTGREPTLVPGFNEDGKYVLFPYYEIINQTGLDLQLVAGQWLWKLESIYRSGQSPEDFFAATGGFEYTLSGVAGTGADLGFIGEWLYDDRGNLATTPFENDLSAGLRFTFNDMEDTQVLAGFVQDIGGSGRVFTLESSRRIAERWKLIVDAFIVLDALPDDRIYTLNSDDNVTVELRYYF